MSQRDPNDPQRMALHPLGQALDRPVGAIPTPIGGLPPGLTPQRASGQGIAAGQTPQNPPMSPMLIPDSAPDQLIVVPGFTEIEADTLDPNSYAVDFGDDGYVTGILGVGLGAGIGAQRILETMIRGGDKQEDICTDGQAGAFLPFSAFGQSWVDWSDIFRPVARNERWRFQPRNVGTIAATPDITLKFRSLRSLASYQELLRQQQEIRDKDPKVLAQTGWARTVRIMGDDAGNQWPEITPGGRSRMRTWRWPEDGYVIGMMCTVANVPSTVGPTSLAFSLNMGSAGTDFVTNGQDESFALCSAFGVTQAHFMPMFRAVDRTNPWTLQFLNRDPNDLSFVPLALFKFMPASALMGLRI